jgi:hypothetical protein
MLVKNDLLLLCFPCFDDHKSSASFAIYSSLYAEAHPSPLMQNQSTLGKPKMI